VSGVQQVIATVCEDDGFAFLFPPGSLFQQFRARVETSHRQ